MSRMSGKRRSRNFIVKTNNGSRLDSATVVFLTLEKLLLA